MFGLVVFSVVLIGFTNSLHLPGYIKPCRYSADASYKKCVLESATNAFPYILKGDKKYGVVNFLPLVVPEVVLTSPNMKLTLRNLEIRGLENTVFEDIDFDIKTKKGKMIITLSKDLIYDGDYEMDGRILVLPLKGKGRTHLELSGLRYIYNFEIELFTKNGEQYMRVINLLAMYTVKGMRLRFDNLFNGDKRLGEEMNKVLNENWQVVNQDLAPSVAKTNAEICFSIANAYFTKIPLREIFSL